MTDILGSILGRATAPIGALAVAIQSAGQITEFTGEEVEALGQLEQQLAEVVQRARQQVSGDTGEA